MRDETNPNDIAVVENEKKDFKNHLQFLYKKHLLPPGNSLSKIFCEHKCYDAVVRVIYDRVASNGQHYVNKLEDNYLCKDIMASIYDVDYKADEP